MTDDPRYTNAALARRSVLALGAAVKGARRKPDSWYRQSGVIAVRIRDGAPQVLLVTSARGKRWVIPKGIVEESHTPAQLRGEGGLGRGGGDRAGRAPDAPGATATRSGTGSARVLVYRLDVDEIHREWPEAHVRRRKWHAPACGGAAGRRPGARADHPRHISRGASFAKCKAEELKDLAMKRMLFTGQEDHESMTHRQSLPHCAARTRGTGRWGS